MERDKLTFYLDRIGESSRRSRFVFYTILISGLMIFAFSWREAEWGWLKARMDLRQGILNHWDEIKELRYSAHPPPEKDWGRWLAALDGKNMTGQTDEDKKLLETELAEIDDQWNNVFKVPFMDDVAFDPNDFVFFSTLELVILAIIFFHCLVREDENLRIFFAAVEHETHPKLKEYYEMATMLQLWTIPKGINRYTGLVLRISMWPIFFFPLLVELWILTQDMKTHIAWDTLNKSLGQEIWFLNYSLFIVLFAATLGSTWHLMQMNRRWDAIEKKISRATTH